MTMIRLTSSTALKGNWSMVTLFYGQCSPFADYDSFISRYSYRSV